MHTCALCLIRNKLKLFIQTMTIITFQYTACVVERFCTPYLIPITMNFLIDILQDEIKNDKKHSNVFSNSLMYCPVDLDSSP